MQFLQSLLLLLPVVLNVSANVEKTIFIAPSLTTIPTVDPSLDDLGLQRLSPLNPILRTQLNASFPTDDSLGTDSWYFLENLTPGRRYEARICWLATQPTDFTLTTYTLLDAIEDPALFSSISVYSAARLADYPPQDIPPDSASTDPSPTTESVLFLRVRAAADYYSLDRSLMESVPPVRADIILDPFLGNVFPLSLVPTACYMCVIGCVAALLGSWVWGQFGKVAEPLSARQALEKRKTK
ncbi:hypothetical protein EYZ11_006951 [Aspergillus tanneri]|uniref:Uncharacterized protein n=1 Tax=Aspergillus tanneri TaxID=1220188 RepID=A0A4S3JGK6_9EURO|nr:uncharacterized protein ATNIH1004_010375 [Aspergillus tanneri]KAA8643606.1 hypothetical protein ATNIH1004_010375 [Aspergillus tanneri]THC93558.1 hypothetical protein EYZ11_006951 [Aspergillus tanneri]